MPDYISMRFPLVPPSGVTEILAGAIFFFDPMSSIGAWGNMLMIVVFLTVHIHMIVHARRFANIPSRGQWLRLALPLPTVASARRLTRPAKSIAGSARA